MQTLIIHMKDNFNLVFVARMIEWEHSILLAMFGWVLLADPTLFETAASYAGFRNLYDSWMVWGYAACAVGGGRFLVLVKNGTLKRSPQLRALFATITAFFWFEASYGAIVADKLTPLTMMCASFFVWQFIIFIICVRYAKLEAIKVYPSARKNNA